jgi:hypothetical protein
VDLLLGAAQAQDSKNLCAAFNTTRVNLFEAWLNCRVTKKAQPPRAAPSLAAHAVPSQNVAAFSLCVRGGCPVTSPSDHAGVPAASISQGGLWFSKLEPVAALTVRAKGHGSRRLFRVDAVHA